VRSSAALKERAMPAEALLPGTDAIMRGSVEWGRYRGGWLVRYRNLEGYTAQGQFDNPDLAHAYALECIAKLRAEIRETGYAR
jgi:hypothetical protein